MYFQIVCTDLRLIPTLFHFTFKSVIIIITSVCVCVFDVYVC